MKQFMLGLGMVLYGCFAFAGDSICASKHEGYKVVPNTNFSFSIDGKKACFFAFYIDNPAYNKYPNHNDGDAIVYGYYMQDNPDEIEMFPFSKFDRWTDICTIDAISFWI